MQADGAPKRRSVVHQMSTSGAVYDNWPAERPCTVNIGRALTERSGSFYGLSARDVQALMEVLSMASRQNSECCRHCSLCMFGLSCSAEPCESC